MSSVGNNPKKQLPKGRRSAELPLKPPCKVALVGCPPELCESRIKQINRFPGFICNCVCATGEAALLAVPKAKSNVVLMDIYMPGITGIECTVRLKQRLPQIQIIMLTSVSNREVVIHALEAGVDGYLLQPTKPPDLRNALLDVLRGGAPLTSQITRHVVEAIQRKRKLKVKSPQFSLKEEWILLLLCQGYTNGLIAEKMNLSIHTICCYLKNVFKKLAVNSRTQAAAAYLGSKIPRLNPGDLRLYARQIQSVTAALPAPRIVPPATGRPPHVRPCFNALVVD